MTLNDKCMISYRELILKSGSVKLQVYGKKPSQTPTFERLIFFFRRQSRTSIKQIIFKKYCFNANNHHNNLHILYQEAMKVNIYEMMNLTKTFGSVQAMFYSTTERIALGNT